MDKTDLLERTQKLIADMDYLVRMIAKMQETSAPINGSIANNQALFARAEKLNTDSKKLLDDLLNEVDAKETLEALGNNFLAS